MTRSAARPAVALFAAFAVLLCVGPPAQASNRLTLDASAGSAGKVIQDASGTAYVAWVHTGTGGAVDAPRFCKIARGGSCPSPMVLPIPGVASVADGVSGAFPVFGAAGTVYVVAPRYPRDDVVLYTSPDGGASFDGGVIIPTAPRPLGPYSGKTYPTDVIRSGANFYVAANNVGLGFSSFGATQGAISFANPGPSVASSTLGLDSAGNPVAAYWTLTAPYSVLSYRYTGAGAVTSEASWSGPTTVSAGYQPRLAGGRAGLFLASQDYASPASPQPSVLNVRKDNGTSFGAPVTLAVDADINLLAAGQIAQSPSGLVAVAWPAKRAGDNLYAMRLFLSGNGGASFAGPINVAAIAYGYGLEDNAQLAIGDDGQGWLTFRDSGGLRVADLAPIAPYTPQAPATYSGTTTTVAKPVDRGIAITLTLPKTCVQARQPFKVFVGTRIKHKIAGGRRGKVTKVTFKLDATKLTTIKHKPFSTLVPGLNAASKTKHTVQATVTVRIHRPHHKPKTKTKTLNGSITIC